MAKTHRKISLFSILVFLFVTLCYGDINQDKQECASQLVGLATCLPYVSGQAKAPTQDCCAGFKQVLKESRKCVCILVKDRDDPSLGLKINATLALTLPATCHSPASVNDCPGNNSQIHGYGFFFFSILAFFFQMDFFTKKIGFYSLRDILHMFWKACNL